MNVVYGKTNLVEVDRETFYEFLTTTPGLHNWNTPGGLGFSDAQGIIHGFLAKNPDGVKFFMSWDEVYSKKN